MPGAAVEDSYKPSMSVEFIFVLFKNSLLKLLSSIASERESINGLVYALLGY